MAAKKSGMRRGLTAYGDEEFSLFLRKAFIKAMGYTDDALERPIIGITNTFSGFNACHRNVPELIDAVKRGVMLAGGLPVEFPVITLHESFAFPTSMYLRNMMSMDTEEMIRAQPVDATVLIGGCDKTVPALLMGAASANVPAIMLVTGPMLTGNHRGERLGACTDCRRFWARFRAGEIDQQEINEVNEKLAPTAGTCMVMGTASTMALCTEAMGMMLPGGAAIPAVMADRIRNAEATGARAVAIAKEKLTPAKIMTVQAFENALRVLLAISGSTNAIVHLAAMAGRLGIELDLEAFDRIGRETPVLVDLKPTGQHYMEDLYRVGGLTHDIARNQAAAESRCADDHRPHARRGNRRRAGDDQAGRGAAVQEPDIRRRRHGGAARQSRARRRDRQAVGGDRETDAARRARRGLRYARRSGGEDRLARSRRDCRRRARVAQCRPQRCARHARSRLHPDSEKARAAGRQRHGAHFGRAHERHRVRFYRPAHHTGVGGRRAARARQGRRPHQARRCAIDGWSCWCPTRSSKRAAKNGARRSHARETSAAIASCSSTPCSRPIAAAISNFLRRRRLHARRPDRP